MSEGSSDHSDSSGATSDAPSIESDAKGDMKVKQAYDSVSRQSAREHMVANGSRGERQVEAEPHDEPPHTGPQGYHSESVPRPSRAVARGRGFEWAGVFCTRSTAAGDKERVTGKALDFAPELPTLTMPRRTW